MAFTRTSIAAACIVFACSLTATAHAASQDNTILSPFEKAVTFAQVREGEQVSTLLVVALNKGQVTTINLSELSGLYSADAFDVIGRFEPTVLEALSRQAQRTQNYPVERLLGVGPRGLAHIAAGTNYPAHGKEVGHEQAFLFPKLSQATGPRSTITAAPGALLDYEVEVCARFDREIRNMADFEAARKGFFLCGDYSDRAALVRNINLKDVGSGDGFPDAKSGPNRFPAGPFLVVPHNWKAFLEDVSIETWVNGQRRQHAKAGDMLKDLRTIVKETLEEAEKRTWSYGGGRIPMVHRAAIGTDSAVLTGTGEGVVFKEPGPAVIKELMTAKDRAQQLASIDRYVSGEIDKRIYLQPGNQVRYTSNYLGAIHSLVVAPNRFKK